MDFSGFVVQGLNGLAGASSLFLVAAGLSLIFGVTRIVNFAHGSFFMAGIYIAYTVVDIEQDDAAAAWVATANGGNQTVPTLRFADGSALTNPSVIEVQAHLAQLQQPADQ